MNDEIMQSFWVYTIIIIIVFALIWIPLIRLSFRHQKEEKQRQEAKAIEEAKQQEIREKEAREYNKLLEKAEKLDPDFKYELSRLNKEKSRLEVNSVLSKSMAGTSRYLASAYRQKSDPYIRGGIASALGGSGLGVYTALKTDEQNRQNDIKRQQALDDVSKYSSESIHYSSDSKMVGRRYNRLKEAVESYYIILINAEKIDKIFNIDNYSQNIIKSDCSEYIKNFSEIKITSALYDEGHKEEWRKSNDAQKRILHFGEIIDKGLEVAEKASKLGEENLNSAKEIYLKCMSDERNKKVYNFTSPDEYGFEKALAYEKQDNN